MKKFALATALIFGIAGTALQASAHGNRRGYYPPREGIVDWNRSVESGLGQGGQEPIPSLPAYPTQPTKPNFPSQGWGGGHGGVNQGGSHRGDHGSQETPPPIPGA